MKTKLSIALLSAICAALLLAPAASAADSSLSTYGGGGAEVVEVKAPARPSLLPLPFTGQSVALLVVAATMLVGVGVGAQRLAHRLD